MDGVLESTIMLCGCKVLCSFLFLPALKGSVSSVSLCCICLLLFTDLSITGFLMYLWLAAPRPFSFHPSSDDVALRFMLFLSETYEAVLMLTPLLVTMELLVHLLLGGEAKEDTVPKDVDSKEKGEDENNAALLKAFGFLGCLMLWFMSGTYAGFSWRHEQAMVRSCLEGGRLLSSCLPCLFTASSLISGLMFWVIPAAVLLLAFTMVVNLIVATPNTINSTLMVWVQNVDSLHQTPPERTSIATASDSHNCVVDSEKAANSCAIHSAYNKQNSSHGNPEPLSRGTEPADGWKLNSESVTLVVQENCKARRAPRSRLWQTIRGSPCPRGELITGLLCGLLVCVLPTVLSTNILLVCNMDTLAVYVVKHLLTPLQVK